MKLHYNDKKFYNHLEEWIGAVLLVFMLVMLFAQVVMRYILHMSAAWISEYALYIFMYFVFLACSGAFLRNDHIQIIALISKCPQKIQNIWYLVVYIGNLLFCTLVGYYCFLRVIDQMQMQTVSITQFPLWVMSASLAIGMTTSMIRCAMNIYFLIKYDILGLGSKEEN